MSSRRHRGAPRTTLLAGWAIGCALAASCNTMTPRGGKCPNGVTAATPGVGGLGGNGPDPYADDFGYSSAALVYGQDDRRDFFEHPDERLRGLTRDSIVALMPPSRVRIDSSGDVEVRGEPLGTSLGLCPNQPYLDQPRAAECSGTLIDVDLVLTAGHCIKTEQQCRSQRFVFGYYFESPGRLATMTRDDVYSCERLLVRRQDQMNGIDYAIVKLDRAAAPRHRPAPVALDPYPVHNKDPIYVIGFGVGLPAKLDSGGRVIDARTSTRDYFSATPDTFEGNSGSGVFDARLRLVGVLVRGQQDFVDRCGCKEIRRLGPNGSRTSAESVVYAGYAIADLCSQGWPSELCGRTAQCGDGQCTGMETPTTCDLDCDGPVCGDGVCVVGEYASCPQDCADRGRRPPSSWTCPSGRYAAGDECDCDCGAYDPDCGSAQAPILGCEPGQTCNRQGQCSSDGWTCEDAYFSAGDGCDCNCGIRDPDCDDPAQTVFHCPEEGMSCDLNGQCTHAVVGPPADGGTPDGVTPVTPPASWTCSPGYYSDTDCDCECGAYDPTCAQPTARILGCQTGQTCGTDGHCTGTVPPPPGGTPGTPPASWSCSVSWYGVHDGCDCNCGAYDPDCADPSATVYRCNTGETCNSAGQCQAGVVGPPAPGTPPASWVCGAEFYNAADGCDCSCGAYDPDCAIAGTTVYHCNPGEVCNSNGQCAVP